MGKSQGNLRKGGQSLVLAENRWLSPTGPQSKEKTETIDSSEEKNRGALATAESQGATPPPGPKDTGENLKELCSLEAEEPNKLQAAHRGVGGHPIFSLSCSFPAPASISQCLCPSRRQKGSASHCMQPPGFQTREEP